MKHLRQPTCVAPLCLKVRSSTSSRRRGPAGCAAGGAGARVPLALLPRLPAACFALLPSGRCNLSRTHGLAAYWGVLPSATRFLRLMSVRVSSSRLLVPSTLTRGRVVLVLRGVRFTVSVVIVYPLCGMPAASSITFLSVLVAVSRAATFIRVQVPARTLHPRESFAVSYLCSASWLWAFFWVVTNMFYACFTRLVLEFLLCC